MTRTRDTRLPHLHDLHVNFHPLTPPPPVAPHLHLSPSEQEGGVTPCDATSGMEDQQGTPPHEEADTKETSTIARVSEPVGNASPELSVPSPAP